LWRDARMPIAALADQTGFAPQRLADAIATLRQRGELRFRIDIARAYVDWPIYTWYFVEVPARVVAAARTAITSVPEVRLAMTAASRYNLILAVWLRTMADVNRFEMALETALQGSRIADRAVVLRIAKQMGRVVGPDTRALEYTGGALARPLGDPELGDPNQ
ncbi:Lrp/AsnC family transcriptional regulator, partial [Microbacterium sp.]|uniref:Lrp/AsnC family transcriptional regulator n=1 Tax=Microbacterium sp. TaxID=51671 RepID=UPI003C78A30A